MYYHLYMNVIEFTNLLKINNNQFISNNIPFFLSKLNNFKIKKNIEKPINITGINSSLLTPVVSEGGGYAKQF